MRYILTETGPQKVTTLITNGIRIVNPNDAQIDAAGAGYPLEDTPAPEYDPQTQYPPARSWEILDGVITKVWTISDIPAEILTLFEITSLRSQIDAINADYEAFKSLPVEYPGNGKSYLPRYIPELYTPLRMCGEGAFPRDISAYDDSIQTFTFEEFTALYDFLMQYCGAEIARVNASIVSIKSQIAALEASNG